jgi:hypothetical protein
MVAAMISDLEDKIAKLTDLRDAAQEQYDNKSDKWHESEKGEQAQEQIDYLTSICDNLESAKDDLENAMQNEPAWSDIHSGR